METTIHFSNDQGEILTGVLVRPEAEDLDFGVVLGHCFTCSRHTRILIDLGRALAGKGIWALRFDFSGNGQSQGAFENSSYSKHIREMKVAVKVLRDRGPGRFGLAGHSMGAAVALFCAAQSAAQGVATLAGRFGSLNPRRLLSEIQRDQLRQNGQVSFVSRGRSLALPEAFFKDADQYDPSETASGLERPLLIVHGDRDEVIPVSEARLGKELKPEQTELVIIQGGDHMFSQEDHRRQAAESAAQWFFRLAVQ